MSSKLIWDNLVTYSLQIGLLVALASFVPALLRLRLPKARLVYLQILLAACLLLPLVRPWRQAVATGNIEVSTSYVTVIPVKSTPSRSIPKTEIALFLLAAGALVRLGWLGVGFWRLRRYRLHSHPIDLPSPCPTLLSDEIASPVTFGLRRPVVLLPGHFPDLDHHMQDAILTHELLHVERSDWAFTVAEELVRAIFWFHPAIWWLLGEVQLAREQAVDQEVVNRTQARDEYVDALLAIAGAGPQLDLAPAPLFLRKRHLKQRVVSILKEVRMSKTRLISGLAAALGMLMATCWFVTATFPLAAAPQVVNDAVGVSVDVRGAELMHRSPVSYPESARRKGIQGTVTLEATLDAGGNVVDAHVLTGPDELRRAALESLLQWHFANGSAGATRQVSIAFQAPDEPQANIIPRKGAANPLPNSVRLVPNPVGIGNVLAGRTVKQIQVAGLSDQARTEVLSRLPIHEGDSLTPESFEKFRAAVKEYDEHLSVGFNSISPTETSLTITAPDTRLPMATPGVIGAVRAMPRDTTNPPQRINVGGAIEQAMLISQPKPAYPEMAKAARIQGVVQFEVIIGKDGHVKDIQTVPGKGHPLLVAAAMDAVKEWVYRPTLLNGEPVEVKTTVDVNFTLSQ